MSIEVKAARVLEDAQSLLEDITMDLGVLSVEAARRVVSICREAEGYLKGCREQLDV